MSTAITDLASITKDAHFSPCGTYRYKLLRRWSRDVGPVCWIMLNPSTADAEVNDPTVERCQRFAARWGYGGIVVVNLFALRATDPRQLRGSEYPIGPLNDAIIESSASNAHKEGGIVVAAWGNHGGLLERSADVCSALSEAQVPLYCLKITGAGEPTHPLYQRGDSVPMRWA